MTSSRPLALPLSIDARSKGVLEAQRNKVHEQHPDSQQDTSWLAKDKRGAQETHGRAIVHGRIGDVEREPGDHVVHQDAEVVSQKGTRDAQRPGRGDDEGVTGREEGIADVGGQRALESRVRGLVTEGALVEAVADEADGEDCRGEGVAGCSGVAAEDAGQEVSAVFSSCDNTGELHVSIAASSE